MDSAETKVASSWSDQIVIRHLRPNELIALEWDGAYSHFRRVYARALQRAQNGMAVLWVAEGEESSLIGQVFVLLNSEFDPQLANGEDRAFIHSFRVRPEYRSRGLGARLLQIAEADLAARNFKIVGLNVADDNVSARRFYERYGYRPVMKVSGEWSYTDHLGVDRDVKEPGWRLIKNL
jgi:ribosomal protein S18 acetylase RimI-like enzyme